MRTGITPVCTICYLTYDQAGSALLIRDQNASVVGRHDYVPYGEEIFSGTGGRSWNGFGSDATAAQMFTGQALNGGTAVLDYVKTRHMSAVLGSFTQPDPGNAGATLRGCRVGMRVGLCWGIRWGCWNWRPKGLYCILKSRRVNHD